MLLARFVEELHAFDQSDLEESILSEMETRLHTRAVFAMPSLQQQAAASAPTRSPETRSAKRARTQREPSPVPAADEPKPEAAGDAEQSAAPGTAEPSGESSTDQKPAPESSENPAPPAAAVQPPKEDGAAAPADSPAATAATTSKSSPESSPARSLDASMDAYMAEKLLGKRSLLVLVRWIHGVVRCVFLTFNPSVPNCCFPI